MKNFAVVSPDGAVTNVVVGESLEIVEPVVGPCIEVTVSTGPAAPGYVWDGRVFVVPVDTEA